MYWELTLQPKLRRWCTLKSKVNVIGEGNRKSFRNDPQPNSSKRCPAENPPRISFLEITKVLLTRYPRALFNLTSSSPGISAAGPVLSWYQGIKTRIVHDCINLKHNQRAISLLSGRQNLEVFFGCNYCQKHQFRHSFCKTCTHTCSSEQNNK